MKKKRRALPPHIVLANGMWRFVKRGTKKVKKITVKHKSRGFSKMARRRYSRRRGSSGNLFGGKRLLPVSGMIAAALLGAGAATLSEKIIPQVIPYQGAAIGFAVGGVGGAVGALARDMLKGGVIGTPIPATVY